MWALTDLATKFESHLGMNDVGKGNNSTLAHYKFAPKSDSASPEEAIKNLVWAFANTDLRHLPPSLLSLPHTRAIS